MQLSRTKGWFPWIAHHARDFDHTPYAHRQVEIARQEWESPETVDPRSLDPMTNVVDLWWRPVPQAADICC